MSREGLVNEEIICWGVFKNIGVNKGKKYTTSSFYFPLYDVEWEKIVYE